MVQNTVLYNKDSNIGIITLNRPKVMNAINNELLDELNSVLSEVENDHHLRAVIVTGGVKAFSVGADVTELASLSNPVDIHPFGEKVRKTLKRIEALRQPVIAAVFGLAYGGGCEMALACDIRFCEENARFALPEIRLGVLPGAGGTQRLPRLIGVARAKEMLFTGTPIDAQEAYRIGLVNKVFPAESLMSEAQRMAKIFCEKPGYALGVLKGLVNEGMNMEMDSALVHEAKCFEILFSTEDQKEGFSAFMEKREPVFKHR